MKLKLTSITILFFTTQALGQSIPICEVGTEPSAICTAACLLCDLDGLSRKVNVNNTLTHGVADCKVGVGDLFAFVALSEELRIEVTVQSCRSISNQDISYLSFVGYEDSNGTCFDDEFGETLSPIFPCDNGADLFNSLQWIAPNSQKIFENTQPLIIGNVYFVGFGLEERSNCNYSVKILEGSTKVPELNEPFQLDNLSPPCLGETITYTVQDTIPITQYLFTLNGDTISTHHSAVVEYGMAGDYELCIQGSNYCSSSPENCYQFTIEIPPTQEVIGYICPGQCYPLYPDSTVCSPGNYPLTFSDQNGCDSLVVYQVLSGRVDTTVLSANLCLGDTLSYQGRNYFMAGNYELPLMNQLDCDSIIKLNIVVENCPIEGMISHKDLTCFGDGPTGSFAFSLSSGTAPFNYAYSRLGGGISGNGTITATNILTEVQGIPTGTYLVEVEDVFGNFGYFNTEITQPPLLENTINTSNFNGYELSCAGAANGQIQVSTSGGLGPYQYTWDDSPEIIGFRQDLVAGVYRFITTDQNDCVLENTINFSAPTPLEVLATPQDENCNEPASGSISNIAVTGGVAPYTNQLSKGNDLIAASAYNNLSAGEYLLEIRDANTCVTFFDFGINSPIPAQFTILGYENPIPLGEAIELEASGGPFNHVAWDPSELFNCENCVSTNVSPLNSAWVRAQVESIDGCTATDSIYLNVNPNRVIFVPNAFSPNNDGNNDRLQVFPGKSVKEIIQFSIFDRWGNQLYAEENISVPFENSNGWDGRSQGQLAASGIYVWMAEIQYIDGHTDFKRGGVLLLR